MEMKQYTESHLSIFSMYIKENISVENITNREEFPIPQDNAENILLVLEVSFFLFNDQQR